MAAASKNPLVRLGHMRDEITSITAELKNVDRNGFTQNYLLVRAAERALLIISEAAKALPRDLVARYPEIDWRGVRGLGDVLRHDYSIVDADTLWEILTGKVPALAEVVGRMIDDLQKIAARTI
jgi:uncharacterized protein with HEPN domain